MHTHSQLLFASWLMPRECLSNCSPGKRPQLLLLSTRSYGMGCPFGHLGSRLSTSCALPAACSLVRWHEKQKRPWQCKRCPAISNRLVLLCYQLFIIDAKAPCLLVGRKLSLFQRKPVHDRWMDSKDRPLLYYLGSRKIMTWTGHMTPSVTSTYYKPVGLPSDWALLSLLYPKSTRLDTSVTSSSSWASFLQAIIF